MEDTLLQALDRACANLDQAAAGLGAESAAVLLNTDGRVALEYFRSRSGGEAPARILSAVQRKRYDSLNSFDGAIEAGSAAAQFLRETISAVAHSFLLWRWDANPRGVAVVFGFANGESTPEPVPDTVTASLNLAALATWSAYETGKLRAELKDVNARLAGRKLVERAKSALQAEQSLSEEQAYAYLRNLSRKRRITLATLSAEILGSRTARSVQPAGNPGPTA